jgi:hypothetical protein
LLQISEKEEEEEEEEELDRGKLLLRADLSRRSLSLFFISTFPLLIDPSLHFSISLRLVREKTRENVKNITEILSSCTGLCYFLLLSDHNSSN